MSYFKEQISRDLILDHIKRPRNIKVKNTNYKSKYLKNPACGDELTLYVLFNKDKIEDLTYEVSGCSICRASTSMMSELVIGKSKKEVTEITNNFKRMVAGESYKEELLKDAIGLSGVSNIPPRIKCATLCYNALLEIIGGNDEK